VRLMIEEGVLEKYPVDAVFGMQAKLSIDRSVAPNLVSEKARAMEIKRNGSQASIKGPVEWFTGAVRIDPLFPAADPSCVSAALVTFDPAARTAWHTHPLGQRLIVASGCGWVQCWGGPKREIHPGDVVVCPPGEKHWHGATATTGMSHFAIQEALDGKVVDWLDKVTDEEYLAASSE
jgi:quercetin dioxygenase-like cupin family protein